MTEWAVKTICGTIMSMVGLWAHIRFTFKLCWATFSSCYEPVKVVMFHCEKIKLFIKNCNGHIEGLRVSDSHALSFIGDEQIVSTLDEFIDKTITVDTDIVLYSCSDTQLWQEKLGGEDSYKKFFYYDIKKIYKEGEL